MMQSGDLAATTPPHCQDTTPDGMHFWYGTILHIFLSDVPTYRDAFVSYIIGCTRHYP